MNTDSQTEPQFDPSGPLQTTSGPSALPPIPAAGPDVPAAQNAAPADQPGAAAPAKQQKPVPVSVPIGPWILGVALLLIALGSITFGLLARFIGGKWALIVVVALVVAVFAAWAFFRFRKLTGRSGRGLFGRAGRGPGRGLFDGGRGGGGKGGGFRNPLSGLFGGDRTRSGAGGGKKPGGLLGLLKRKGRTGAAHGAGGGKSNRAGRGNSSTTGKTPKSSGKPKLNPTGLFGWMKDIGSRKKKPGKTRPPQDGQGRGSDRGQPQGSGGRRRPSPRPQEPGPGPDRTGGRRPADNQQPVDGSERPQPDESPPAEPPAPEQRQPDRRQRQDDTRTKRGGSDVSDNGGYGRHYQPESLQGFGGKIGRSSDQVENLAGIIDQLATQGEEQQAIAPVVIDRIREDNGLIRAAVAEVEEAARIYYADHVDDEDRDKNPLNGSAAEGRADVDYTLNDR